MHNHEAISDAVKRIVLEIETNQQEYPSHKIDRIRYLCKAILCNIGEDKVYELVRCMNKEIRFIK